MRKAMTYDDFFPHFPPGALTTHFDLEHSSTLHYVAWNAETLFVVYRRTGSIYRFEQVPYFVWLDVSMADSPGSELASMTKGARYAYARIGSTSAKCTVCTS